MRSFGLILVGLVLAGCQRAAAQEETKATLVLDSGGHTRTVQKVLFTPDGREIITAARDYTVRIWSTTTGETLRVLRLPLGNDQAFFKAGGLRGNVSGAALAPDGRLLAVSTRGENKKDSGGIYLIALRAGRIERVLTGTGAGSRLTFSPDGKWLAVVSKDRPARLWDVASGKAVHDLQGNTPVTGLAFSPDSRRVVGIHGGNNNAFLWQVTTGKHEEGVLRHPDVLTCVAWSPDGKTIATGSDKSIFLWDALAGTLRNRLPCPQPGIHSLTFLPDARALLVTGTPGYAAILDLNGKERVRFTGHTVIPARPGAVVASVLGSSAPAPDGRLAATHAGPDANQLFVWRTTDGTLVHHLGSKGRVAMAVGWSPDGKTVAWGNTTNGEATGVNRARPLERSFSLTDLDFGGSPEANFVQGRTRLGNLSAVKMGPKKIVVHRGKKAATMLPIRANVVGFTLLPGDRAIVARSDSWLELVDTRTGQLQRTAGGGGAHLTAFAPSPDFRYVITAAIDQTLHVWRADRLTPLLSLFIAGDDWIAWTPEGYYAASPGGEKLMGWHVDNGPRKLATFHPAARFRQSLYRPDVIKLMLQTGSVAEALKAADKARGQATAAVQVDQVLPPTVVLTAPDRPVTVVEPKLEVRAFAQPTGNHPITALRLLLDGRPYDGDKGLKPVTKPGPGPVHEAWQVTLTPGTHELAVLAESAVSKGLSESVQVTLDASRGMKPVPKTAEQKRQELPRLHVLAIGISKYKQKDLALKYATKDAEVLAKTFASTGKGLFRDVKVQVLADAQATRANLLDQLEEFPKQVSPGDVAVITFAGHGTRDAKGQFFLLPVDARPDKLLSTCVDGEQVKRVLASLPCKVILVLDACHSGAVGSVANDLVRDLVSEDYGVIVMCSAMGREVSLESDQVGHGFFTKALVEGLSGGLRGQARSADGLVYLHQLDAYIYDRVKELSNDRQHPAITRPTSIRSFALARP